MVNWRHEAAEAVGTETAHTGGTEQATEDEWHDLGPVRDSGDGLVVDLRATRLGRLLDVRLAGAAGPREGAAVPVGVRLRRGVLRLDDPGPLPAECDRAWARIAATDYRASVLQGLGFAPLADRLATGRPDRAHGDPKRACFLPGVRLIRGGPGSGKTTLLNEAADELARDGFRVLLLTRTEQVLTCVPDQARLTVQQQLADLSAAESRLPELRELLRGFDRAAYDAVRRRIDDQLRADEFEEQLTAAQRDYDVAAADLAQARQELRRARADWTDAAEGRRKLTELRALTARLADVDAELARLHLRVERRPYRGKNRDRKALYRTERERDSLRQRITACSEEAITAERASALDTALSDAHHWLDEAARDESEAYTRVQKLHAKIAQLRSTKPSEQDIRFHAECVRRGLPDLQTEYDDLARASAEQAARRGQLEERLWWLGEGACVGTDGPVHRCDTLPHGDAGTRFDVVLVDDAGSRPLSEVLAAVGLARHTAVVAGDPDSPQPWLGPELRDEAAVRRWCGGTVFSHCGIRTAEDARMHGGCYVLTTSRRVSLDRDADLAGAAVADGTERRKGRVVVLDTAGESVRHAGIISSLPRGSAVIAPHRTAAARWLEAAGQRYDLAIGTARTMHGEEFEVVLVDLVSDDWHARTRAFASATSRARGTLYLLADAAALASAAPGTPLGRVHAAGAELRAVGDTGVPAPRATTDPAVVTP
ncbi:MULTISPECIES: hypothetical protein [Prauserella salsuginis group]|uniref:AAA domain-containing protein n=1 Tax=Prauserella salsuginis TaxID=387889 RepID=A0ABW6FYT9_9PSEU|nr:MULTISPECIES: hypothetical protein [Prauserella salsuginis group]MCR3720250.1 hypothetical protein [Prauserella flava]MCR3734041.1 hypothetical protein [Prauserella salsuginis]